jgi:hypothetical protein
MLIHRYRISSLWWQMPRKVSSRRPDRGRSVVGNVRLAPATIGAVPSTGELVRTLTAKMRRKEYLSDAEIQLLRNAGVRLTKGFVTQREFISSARWFSKRFERVVGIDGKDVYTSNLMEPWLVMEEGDEFDTVVGLNTNPLED